MNTKIFDTEELTNLEKRLLDYDDIFKDVCRLKDINYSLYISPEQYQKELEILHSKLEQFKKKYLWA